MEGWQLIAGNTPFRKAAERKPAAFPFALAESGAPGGATP
jgi:hypothetical protein